MEVPTLDEEKIRAEVLEEESLKTENQKNKLVEDAKNKTDATTQMMRQHDEFVQKVYQTHGKNLKQ